MNYFVIPGIIKPEVKPKSLSFFSEERILTAVMRYFDIDKNYLLQKSKSVEVCSKRQIVMYFLEKHTNYSLSRIAKMFNQFDHISVICARKSVNNMMDTDERAKNMIKEIEENI